MDPISEPGLVAASVLAQRLWDTGRYAELYNLLRESLMTAFSLAAVKGELYQPGNKKIRWQRKQIEDSWRPLLRPSDQSNRQNPEQEKLKIAQPDKARNIARRIEKVAGPRNDVAHCSIGPNPKTEQELRDELERTLKEFKEWVAGFNKNPMTPE